MEILTVVSIVIVGLLVGTELAIAAFVHPTLDRLPDEVHLPAAIALARLMGLVMPAWYPLVFLLTLAEGLIQWHLLGHLPILTTVSAILWVLASLYSVTCLVPINNRIASWVNGDAPSDWKSFRYKWDVLQRWRVALLTIAFACLVVGVLGN